MFRQAVVREVAFRSKRVVDPLKRLIMLKLRRHMLYIRRYMQQDK
jgi:hypothetical protein